MRSAFACAIALLAASFHLPAQAERLAVVSLARAGQIPAAEADAVDEAIAAQLRALGNEVLAPTESRAGIEARSPGCTSTERHVSCMAAALHEMGWERFVSGHVGRQRSETRIRLEAYLSRTGEQLIAKSGATTANGRAAILELARAVAGDLFAALAAASRQAHLSVDSEPTGASVWLVERLLGRTPWTGELPPGPALVRIELRGHVSKTRDITLAPGGRHELSVTLDRERAVARAVGVPRHVRSPEPATRADWQLPVGLGGLAVGAGLIVVGIYGMTVQACTARYADGPCAEERTGTVWGGVSLGTGVLVAAVGVITAFVLRLGPDSGESNESE